MNLKNIIIVGGGTAGWLTAMWLKTNFKKLNITVIESDEIDILGVGEGGVPVIMSFLKQCNIDVQELFRKTNATVKLGLKLTNWNGDGKSYYHPFSGNFLKISNIEWPEKTEEDNEFNVYDEETGELIQHEYDVNKDIEIKDFYRKLKKSYWNRVYNDASVDFLECTSVFPIDSTIPDYSIEDIHILAGGEEYNTGLSFHFDSILLGNFLKEKCLELGVNHVRDTVFDIIKNEEQLVEKVQTKNLNEYECDLIFDCSGQSKIVISSFDDYDMWPFPFLTLNSALAFNLPVDEKIDCWTEATAMNFGWMWKIPLQNRIGCGYVFDDRYIDFNEAKKEIESFIGEPITVQRELTFDAGYVDKPWNRNCIAIGMSQSFVEPLEATSLGSCILQLFKFTESINEVNMALDDSEKQDLSNSEEIYLDEEFFNLKQLDYNDTVNNLIREIADFLLLHYYSKRSDTDFWDLRKDLFEFKDTIEQKENDIGGIEETITFKMMIWNKYPIYYQPSNPYIFFDEFNFICIFNGLEVYEKSGREENLEDKSVIEFTSKQNYEDIKIFYEEKRKEFFRNSLTQLDYLRKYELLA